MSPGLPAYQALAGDFTGKGSADAAPTPTPQITSPLSLPNTSIPGAGINTGLPNSQIPGLELPANAVANSGVGANLTLPQTSLPSSSLVHPQSTAQVPLGTPQATLSKPGENGTSGSTSGGGSHLNPASKGDEQKKDAGGETTKETANQLSQDLSDQKKDKASVLSWVFDRLRRKSSVSLDEVNAGAPSRRADSGLSKATPGEKGAKKPLIERVTGINLAGYTSTEKAYILGQSAFMFGAAIYITSMPLLVKALAGSAADTGIVRMTHYWTLGIASLFAGEIVKRVPMKKVLVTAGIGRAAIYAAIGGLALMGGLHWGLFVGLVGANALLVAHNHLVDMDAAGANKIFSTPEKRKQAFRLYKTLRYSMLLVMPWVLGLGMDKMDSLFGAGTGPKAGFLAFAAMMGITAWIYQTRLKMAVLDVVDGATAVASKFSPRKIAGNIGRFLKETPARNWATFKIIWGNKPVLIRTIMSTVEQFLEDALFFVVLPTFAVETLGAGGFGNGMVLSSMYLGGLITSLFLVKKAPRLEKKMGAYKFVAMLSIGAAAAVIPSVALWMVPSLWVVLPVVALMKLLLDPIQTQMQSLLQESIDSDPKTKANEENIFGLMTVFETLAAGAGGLAFTWIFKNAGATGVLTTAMGANAPMKIVTAMLGVFSIVYLVSLPFLKKQLSKSVFKVHKSNDGDEAAALVKLETNLKKMNLPAYKTATVDAPAGDRSTVAILAPASVYKLAIAREGARQSPGDVHLVLDPSWITQAVSHDGKNRLLLNKGLVFDAAGQATIVTYKTPLGVRYFANFYTEGANGRRDGEPLEKDLNVPQSNSLQLEKVTNDKLLTRLMLAAKGVGVPATLALLMAAHPLNAQAATVPSGAAMTATPMPESREQVKASVEQFLKGFSGPEIVVKPSGPNFHSGIGVQFFTRDQVDAMVDHVLALKADKQMSDDGVVLVEQRILPPALYFRNDEYSGSGDFGILEGKKVRIAALQPGEIASAKTWEKKDWNFRVLAARTPDGGGATTGIFSRAGAWGLPTNAEAKDPRNSAAIVSLEEVVRQLRLQHGLLKTDAEAAAFKADLDRIGEESVKALAANEAKRVRGEDEPWQAQTDFIGLDVIVEVENGKIVPKIIEVNDHDAGGQAQLDEFYPDQAGAHSREWVATMLARARRDALKGKRIVVVGAGYPNKRAFLEKAKALGVEVVLVDKGLTGVSKLVDWARVKLGYPSKDNWAKDLVSEFIDEDLSVGSAEAVARAAKKLQRSARKNGKLDGITSYWEDDVLETAKVAEALGMPYHPVEAVEIARSKHRSIDELTKRGVHKRASYKIESRAQLEDLIKSGDAPAKWFLKPENGAEAQFSSGYKSGDLLTVYDDLAAKLAASDDPVFKISRAFTLTNFLDGHEWDYNVVIQDGKFVDGRLTDNWPTNPGSSKATGSSLPAREVTPAEQIAAHDLTVNSLLALGFRDGVFHVEGIGEDLLEINVRPGGSYTREWNESVYGVDEAEMLFLTAARIPVSVPQVKKPSKVLEGVFVFAPERGVIKEIGLTAEAKKIPGLHLIVEKKAGKTITDDENRVAMIYAEGKTAEEALAKLGIDPRTDARKLLHLVVAPGK
jgi:hypothetical protein